MKIGRILLCSLFFVLCPFVYAQSGEILELSGEVELKHSGSADFIAANVGDQVREDTVISTGFRSSALVEVGSALFTVRPLTRLTLTEISVSAGEETINANLQAGRVRVEVNPPAGLRSSMSVSSPSATASVRGTTIDFDGRHLSTSEGQARLQGSKGLEVSVSAGFAAGVTYSGKAGNPFYTGAGRGRGGRDTAIYGTSDTDFLPPTTTGLDSGSSVTDITLPPTVSPPISTPPPPPPPPPPPSGGNGGGGGYDYGSGSGNGGSSGSVDIGIGWS